MILAIQRYMSKKTQITKNLLFMFVFFWMALLFQLIGLLMKYIWLPNEPYLGQSGSELFSNPQWIIFIIPRLIRHFVLTLIFSVVAIFFFYRFSTLVFSEKEKQGKVGITLALIGMVFLITWGFLHRSLAKPSNFGDFEVVYTIDIYVVLYAFICCFPIMRGSWHLLKRLPRDQPYRRSIQYILLTAAGIVLILIMYALETITNVLSNTAANINVFSFLGSTIMVLTLLFAFRGFFVQKPIN
ncbi:MAG: hypothetical protein RBG13Loki_3522 [Promethearchaeota archaeon CR_4]|nr:MAG: hypothetical protein RBG13Loki_3522 [Candidatus Lokiarchaeota archaeon CR_4]